MKSISEKLLTLEKNSIEYDSAQSYLFNDILKSLNIKKFELLDKYTLDRRDVYSERELYTINEYSKIKLSYYDFEKMTLSNIELVFKICSENQDKIDLSEILINHDFSELNKIKDLSGLYEYDVFIGVLCCSLQCLPKVFYNFLNFVLNDYPKAAIPNRYITSKEGDHG